MYGTKTSDDYYASSNDDTKKRMYMVANGKNVAYWELYTETETEADAIAKKAFGTSANLVGQGEWFDDGSFYFYTYSFCYPIRQRTITLNVVKGSPAETWAKQHKIKYKNVAAGSVSGGDILDAPANLDATKTKNSVTLVWDDVTGASAYRVYKYDTKTKKYVKYKDVSSSKCKVTGLSANTKYKFKVVALKKTNGKYIEGEYATISVTTKK